MKKTTTFLHVMSCSWANRHLLPSYGRYTGQLLRTRRQEISPTLQHLSTKQHSVTSQKTAIFIILPWKPQSLIKDCIFSMFQY